MLRVKRGFDNSDSVKKGWGEELIITNNDEYCGKILCFNKGSKFSFHFHKLKHETFYVLKGSIRLTHIDLNNGKRHSDILCNNDMVTIPRLEPHQIEALTDAEVIEFSTTHHDSDSYRIEPGDSQKLKPLQPEPVKSECGCQTETYVGDGFCERCKLPEFDGPGGCICGIA